MIPLANTVDKLPTVGDSIEGIKAKTNKGNAWIRYLFFIIVLETNAIPLAITV